MGRRNLERVKSLDRAWNSRKWEDYAELIDESAVFFVGSRRMVGKRSMLSRARKICRNLPDAHVHTEPYIDLFMSHDGKKTCSIAKFTGTPHQVDSLVPAIVSPLEFVVAAIARWQNGKLIEMRSFLVGHPGFFIEATIGATRVAVMCRKTGSAAP